jgi:hypothetical protein
MTRVTLSSFSTGEVSPEFHSSIDVEKIRNGLTECTNMIVSPLGGAKNRPGTQYVNDCFDTTKLSRLIPFQFNIEQAYDLEFSNLRMRVIKDGGLVVQDLVDAAYKWTLSGSGTGEYHLELAAGGDPGILNNSIVYEDGIKMTTSSLGSLVEGETAYGDNDALGYNTRYVRITGSTDPDLEAQGYIQVPVLIATPWSDSDIVTLENTQEADTMYLFHELHGMRSLTRSSDIDWTIDSVQIGDGPYSANTNLDGDNTLTVSSHYFNAISNLLISSTEDMNGAEVGKVIRLGFENPLDPTEISWAWGEIQVVTDSKNIEIDTPGTAEGFGHELIDNPEFKHGLDFWMEAAATGSSIIYDQSLQLVELIKVGAAEISFEQEIFIEEGEAYDLRVYLFQIDTGINVQVGNAKGDTSILNASETVAGIKDYVLQTDQATSFNSIWIRFNTAGHAAGTTKIVYVRVRRKTLSTPYFRISAHESTSGFPIRAIIDEQRLILIGSATEPRTFWLSETGNLESFKFKTPNVATDSFSFKPSTRELNEIQWAVLHDGLKIGTSSEIWSVFASSGGVITPTDVNVKVVSSKGSLNLKPIVIGNSILMTPRGFEAVTEMTSSFEASGYVPRDISLLANHLFKDRRIIRWAYARNPDSVIWCVLDDGQLLGLTYSKEYDIWAWHKHSTPLGEGFKDVSVIPNSSDDNIDDVYFVINRAEVGETPNYYIEQLNKRITSQTAAYNLSAAGTPYDYRFLDSALTLNNPKTITNATTANPVEITSTAHGFSDGDFVRIQNIIGMTELNNNVYKVANKTANTYELNDENDSNIDGSGFETYLTGGEAREMVGTVTGLDHIESETVTALGDGAVYENLTVSSGSITLPNSATASFIHIGLPYTPEIETLDIDIQTDQGTTQSRKKSITKAFIYFNESREAEVSTKNKEEWYPVKFEHEQFGEQPPDLFTGVKEQSVDSVYGDTDRLKIRQAKPLPIEIKRAIIDVDYRG